MGTASATWTRESIQWPKAVSARPSARHTNQAGKKDPRISKEGARPQPVQTVSASIDPRVEGRPSEFVIMAGAFWRHFEWPRRFGKQGLPESSALEFAPVCPSTGLAPGPSVHWCHPADC